MEDKTNFNQLKEIYDFLHGPNGCLWDKKQTLKTLIPKLREEVDELIRAIEDLDYSAIQEELGDLLLLVMFFSKITSKEGKFDIEDVIGGLIDKLKRRHPHVFGDKKLNSTQEIIANWNKIKKEEKESKKERRKTY